MIKLLHVDDSSDDLELTKLHLQRFSGEIQIEWAESVKQALEILERYSLDLILCDYQMPGKDGLYLLHTLRDRGESIPFIFLTGQGNEEIAAEALRAGADDYFTKDVGFAHYIRLISSIQRVVEARKQRLKRLEAEKELAETQSTIANLMSNLPGMAFRFRNDEHWTLEFVSEGCLELTGYIPADLIRNQRKTYLELIHQDDLEGIQKDIRAALRNRHSFRTTFRIHTASGEEKWVWLQGRGIFSKKGELLSLEGFVEDITEHKRANEKIEHLNRVLGAIRNVNQIINREAELGPLLKGICDSLIKNRGYISAWIALVNHAGGVDMTTAAGLGDDFILIKKRLEDGIFPECARQALEKSDLVVTKDPVSSCGSCAPSPEGESGVICSPLIYNNDIYGLLTVSLPAHLCEEQEEIVLLKEVSDDIAHALYRIELGREHMRAEEALRRNQELLRAAIESTADGMMIVDENGWIVYSNKRFTEMWQVQQHLLRSKDSGILNKHLMAQMKDPHDFLAKTERLHKSPTESLETLELKDGRLFQRFSCPLMRDGEVKGRVWSYRDITRLKKAELVQSTLCSIISATASETGLERLFESIHEHLGVLMGYDNFFIALRNEDDSFSFPLYVEKGEVAELGECDGMLSIADYVYRTGVPLLADSELQKKLALEGEIRIAGEQPAVWLGVPLKTREGLVGVMGAKGEKDVSQFSVYDLEILSAVSLQLASVITKRQFSNK